MVTDTQTDMTKLIVPFRNFAKAPKKGGWVKICKEEIAIHFEVLYFDILIGVGKYEISHPRNSMVSPRFQPRFSE